MKVQELNPTEITFNPAIAARKGDPDQGNVDKLALNFQERHAAGLEPQIQPGIVRMVDGHYELITGRHRLLAVQMVNDAGGLDGEELAFSAIVVRAEDEGALVTAIAENEYRVASDIFDRADAMQKLVDLGKKQTEIAKIFGLSEASVTQTLKAGKLEKKFIKAVKDGDLEQDAAILIADLETTDSKRTEIFEECVRHRNRFEEIMTRVETRKAKEEAAGKVEEARALADEKANAAKEAAKAVKEAAKATKETAKLEQEAKGTKQLEKARKQIEEAKAVEKEAARLAKEAEKEAEAAQKALDKAKLEKQKVVEKAKPKVSAEDVKRIAKEKGAKGKGGKELTPTPMSRKEFYVTLEALGDDKENPIPQSAKDLLGTLEAVLDGDKTATQLRNALIKFCVPDKK